MKMDPAWEEAFRNPPEDWREVWSKRVKIARFDTEEKARSYWSKNQCAFNEMHVAIHPKDGYVIYREQTEEEKAHTERYKDTPVTRTAVGWDFIEGD